MVHLEKKDRVELKDSQVTQASLDQQERTDSQDQQDSRVVPALLDLRVLRDLKALQVVEARLAYVDSQEIAV